MVTATDEPGGSEVLATRTKGPLVAYAVAAVVLIASMAAVFVLVTRQDDDRCTAMQEELAQIERDNTLDAAQAWDDIYELREALARRNELQAELRAGGCS
jgi:hypothetical protein